MGENKTLLDRLHKAAVGYVNSLSYEEADYFKRGGRLIPKHKSGSGIHIKPENKGKFTASAKKAGQSVQEHARSVLNNPNATPLQKKRANFAACPFQKNLILDCNGITGPDWGHSELVFT